MVEADGARLTTPKRAETLHQAPPLKPPPLSGSVRQDAIRRMGR